MGLSTTYTKTETDFLIQQLEKKTASGYKGDLSKTDVAPTSVGFYGLLETGVYTNLGGINAQSGKLNFASFDGTTWSLIVVEVSQKIATWTSQSYTSGSQVLKDGNIWENTNSNTTSTDVPGVSDKWKKKISQSEISITISTNEYLINNAYVTNLGKNEIVEETEWSIVNFLKIPKNRKLVLSGRLKDYDLLSNISSAIAFFDLDFNFIGKKSKDDLTKLYDKVVIEDIPDNAVYFKLTILGGDVIKVFLDEYEDLTAVYKVGDLVWDIGKYLGINGEVLSNTNWKITKPLPVNSNFTYLLSGRFMNPAVGSYMVFYKDAEMIYPVAIKRNEPIYQYYVFDGVIDIPEDANYVSFCNEYTMMGQIDLMVTSEIGVSEKLNKFENKKKIIDINLPRFVDFPIGRQTDIFLDNIIGTTNETPLLMKLESYNGKIKLFENQIRFNPTIEEVFPFKVSLFNDTKNADLNNSVKTYIRTVRKNVGTGQTKNIVIAGDSLIDGTATAYEVYRLLQEDADFVINQIGTRAGSINGVYFKDEGRGSWSWEDYVNPVFENQAYAGKTNAFMYNGKLDFKHYLSANFTDITTIDIFVMCLGTNDVTQGFIYATDQKINKIISDAKIFINALLADFPNCKIAVGLPGVGAPVFPYASPDANTFKISISKLNAAYIREFDNGKYHANVTCVMHGAYIERYNSYPYEDIDTSDYISVKKRRYTNEVHPLEIGYKQWGRGIYGKIRAFLDGKL